MFNYFTVNALMLIGLISVAFLIYRAGRDFFRERPIWTGAFLGLFAGLAGAFLMSQSYETSSGVLMGYRNYNIGIGYSSFGYMRDLPPDIVKLDRSLLADISASEKDQIIVRSMMTIIHALGLEVVAEGVERHEQFEKLKQFECDCIQGYLFSRPLPADVFADYCHSMKAGGVRGGAGLCTEA